MIEKYIDDKINEINNKKPGTISEEFDPVNKTGCDKK